MAIYQIDDDVPDIHPTAWVAESAEVTGRVTIGANASIWYGAVLRGDNDRITVGANSNVQDGSVLHADAGLPLTIGADVTVGHQVILHGCTVGDGTLVGMGAVVLNGVKLHPQRSRCNAKRQRQLLARVRDGLHIDDRHGRVAGEALDQLGGGVGVEAEAGEDLVADDRRGGGGSS